MIMKIFTKVWTVRQAIGELQRLETNTHYYPRIKTTARIKKLFFILLFYRLEIQRRHIEEGKKNLKGRRARCLRSQ